MMTQSMTREQAIAELVKCRKDYNTERAHVDADTVLCDLLTALGYGDVVKQYDEVSKWYA